MSVPVGPPAAGPASPPALPAGVRRLPTRVSRRLTARGTAALRLLTGDRRGGTRRFLLRRLTALLVCAALGMTTLLAGYHGVNRNTGAVGDRTAPAILQVAAARAALDGSLRAARDAVSARSAGIEGTGERYRVRVATANQSLARATKDTVAGAAGQQDLRTASSLVSSYTEFVDLAYQHRGNVTLRDAYLTYASDMLLRPGIGIDDRLAAVQSRQRAVLERQTSFGWLLWTAWVTAVLCCAALVWLLLDTQWYLRRQFRRRWNPWLLVATALVVLSVPVLAALSWRTQSTLTDVRRPLDHRITVTSGGAGTAQRVTDTVHDARWRAGAVGWIPIGGGAFAVLVLTGLQQRLDEYRWRQDRRR